MKQISITTIFGVLTLLTASCGSSTSVNVNANSGANRTSTANSSANTASNTMNAAGNTVSNAVASMTTDSPEDFMKEAAGGGLAEVELGKLAATKAQNAEVKSFGQMMVTDHTKANTELKSLAAKKNVTLPTDPGSHKSTMDDLKGLKGADFDEAYVDQMVDDHETDVAAFQQQADNSSDPDVKAFAAKTLPVLKTHLEKIRSIQSKLQQQGNAGQSNTTGRNTNR
jgi:putative membrane protein